MKAPKASKSDCRHGAYRMVGDELVCASCGMQSTSPKWQANVYGIKEEK